MTMHYAADEIRAVHEFAWQNRDQVKGFGSVEAAHRLLDAVAPAIAARALREYADALASNSVAAYWAAGDFVNDVRDWASDVERGRI